MKKGESSMSESNDPVCADCITTPAIELIVDARPRDLGGGFRVARAFPTMRRRTVGPFIFFDHLGPLTLEPGTATDVRPHPHIHLATVTYLFEGEIVHRDSLGSKQSIRPGDLNWMHAGRGIVHSERRPEDERGERKALHGLQLWVALPTSAEETDPTFAHHDASELPSLEIGGVSLRVIAGSAYGKKSPAATRSPLFYVDATMPAGRELTLPEEHDERASYVVSGKISCGAERAETHRAWVFKKGERAVIRAESDSRVMLFGGAALDGPRHIFWNFVSSSEERLQQAKRDWKEGRFPKVPGDEIDFIPLPENR
jgi:redox-sensitive bicupin YhaK (pirin superfamily)